MSNQIFYFSKTGNSIYISRYLQKVLPNCELSSIVDSLKDKNFFPQKKSIGFVFPLYTFSLPIIMKEFVSCLDLSQTEYIYAVITRANSSCRAFNELGKLINKKGMYCSIQPSVLYHQALM